MDWRYPEQDGPSPFSVAAFGFGQGDLDDLEFPQNLLDFDLAGDDGLPASGSASPFTNLPHIDLSNPRTTAKPLHPRRRRADPKRAVPTLSKERPTSPCTFYGQPTPPASDKVSWDTPPSATAPLSQSGSATASPSTAASKVAAASPHLSPPDHVFPQAEPKSKRARTKKKIQAKPEVKRGRKKKVLTPAARDAQHTRTLARNRAAAHRCRQRKKVEHAVLETRARNLGRERAQLCELVFGLQDEVLSLQGAMLRHAGCNVGEMVAEHVRQPRTMLKRGQLGNGEASNGDVIGDLLFHTDEDEDGDGKDTEEDDEDAVEDAGDDDSDGPDADGDVDDAASADAEEAIARLTAAPATKAHAL